MVTTTQPTTTATITTATITTTIGMQSIKEKGDCYHHHCPEEPNILKSF